MRLDAQRELTRASLRVRVLGTKYKNKIKESGYFSTTVLVISVFISGFVEYPHNPVASCEFQPC